uniref:Putative extracellular protein TR9_023 n=1 Tax=Trebouxia lynnae TaxID=1825957 RepID=A0A7L9QEH5_9CHLO|nr:putative extracellular protein TR9_023 [Trebouxia lynnae]
MFARFVALLTVVNLSLCCAGTQRKLTQSTAAPAPVGPSIVSDLLDVLGRNQSIGPQLYKTAEAAVYTSLAYANDTSTVPLDDFMILPLNGGGQVLVAWVDNSTTAVLAWRAADNATEEVAASTVEMSATSFLGSVFASATVNNAMLNPFQQALQGSPGSNQDLATTISRLSNGPFPRRVLCTGQGAGGAYATLCAVWAAVTFPLAQIRHITFGAPAVGDELFNWSVQQLVDLSYPWSTPGDSLPSLPLQLPLPSIIMYLQDNNTRQDTTLVESSLQYYVSALMESIGNTSISTSFAGQNSTDNNSTLVDGISNYGECSRSSSSTGGLFSRIGSAISNFVGSTVCEVSSTVNDLVMEVDAARGYLDNSAEESPGQKNATFTNVDLFSSYGDTCAPVLCKMEAAIVASCQVYENTPGIIGPGSRVIHGDYSTDVGVAWDAANTTALIAFRGSQSSEDWIQDFKQFVSDSPYSTVLEDMYPEAHVHHGFLEQLQAVTDKAPNQTQNIGDVLMDMSGGVPPSLVIVTGHSLGAGVASLAAPWAALQWPGADIRCVTIGNPKPGNQAYSEVCSCARHASAVALAC